jgi:hypothetical protein
MGLAAAQNGLKERRVMTEFSTNVFPNLKKSLQEAAGTPIEVEVIWDHMYHQTADSSYWAENMKKIYFEPLETALKAICSDNMGREALAAKIKKIRIVNTKGGYFDGCSIEGDTFIFDHAPDNNVDYGSDRVKEIQSFLENNL